METEKKFKAAKKWLAIIAALLVLCTILMWGIATGWGNVKISRVSILGDNGSNMTAIQLVPKGVSSSNPAPVVLTNHGRNNSGYSELGFGIELARRGYVVFCCDQVAAGEAPIKPSDSNVVNAESWVNYINSQGYFDGRLVVTGLSAGGTTLAQVLIDCADQIDCAINIVGTGGVLQLQLPVSFDFCSILADADGIDAGRYGYVDGHDTRLDRIRETLGEPDYEFGQTLGSFEAGNAIQINSVRSIHPLCYLFNSVHTTFYSFLDQAIPTNSGIAPDNLIYKTFYLVSWVCCCLFICLGAQFALVLSSAPGLINIMHTERQPVNKLGPRKRTVNIMIDFLLPVLLLPIVFTWVGKMKWIETIWRCSAANPVIGWLFVICVIGFVLLAFRTAKTKKERPLNAADFGMGAPEEEKILNWKRIWCGFVIAVVSTIMMFTWVTAVISITGINYSAHAFAYFTRITPERFVRSIPYVVIIIPIVLLININVSTVRRFANTGNETVDILLEEIVNILISIVPLILYFIEYFVVAYYRGTGVSLLQGGWEMSLNNSLGFPFMMGSSVGISTYLSRKTGNIWSGIFTATLILGIFTITAPLMAG